MQLSREVSQLRGQQVKLRAVCESEVQRAASDATSGVEGLQLRWRQVTRPRMSSPAQQGHKGDVDWISWCTKSGAPGHSGDLPGTELCILLGESMPCFSILESSNLLAPYTVL